MKKRLSQADRRKKKVNDFAQGIYTAVRCGHGKKLERITAMVEKAALSFSPEDRAVLRDTAIRGTCERFKVGRDFETGIQFVCKMFELFPYDPGVDGSFTMIYQLIRTGNRRLVKMLLTELGVSIHQDDGAVFGNAARWSWVKNDDEEDFNLVDLCVASGCTLEKVSKYDLLNLAKDKEHDSELCGKIQAELVARELVGKHERPELPW